MKIQEKEKQVIKLNAQLRALIYLECLEDIKKQMELHNIDGLPIAVIDGRIKGNRELIDLLGDKYKIEHIN